MAGKIKDELLHDHNKDGVVLRPRVVSGVASSRSDVEQELNSFPVKGESSVGRSPAKLFRMRP